MLWIVLLVLMVATACGFWYIKTKLKRLSRQLFQTDSLIDGYQQQKALLAETPKSVSGMTRIYLPQIARDFPEFHYEEFKSRAQQMLCSAFQALDQDNPARLEHASQDLITAISLQITHNQSERRDEHYQDVLIHQTEITAYRKLGGTCTITLQSAVGHRHWVICDGQVVAGDKSLKEQCKYDIDIVYVQDVSQLSSSDQTAFADAICPNCGAPVTATGSKVCNYCGSAIQSVNIRVWNINSFRKL